MSDVHENLVDARDSRQLKKIWTETCKNSY